MITKKLLATVLLSAALAMTTAGNSLAAFGNLALIRVVLQQNGGTTEIATNLGDVSTVLTGGTFGGGADAFTAQTGGTNFAAGSAGLNAVYFAVNQTTKELWITGENPSISAGKSATITALTTNIFSYYNINLGGGPTVLADASYANSYRVKADATTQFGQFGTAIVLAARPFTEANLAPLATGGSVTQTLYYFANYAVASSGVAVATITTNSNGSTTISAVTADTTPPVVTISAATLTATNPTVSISFTATDLVGVTGYLLNESSTKPTDLITGWTAISSSKSYGGSASYTFSNTGTGASSTGTVYVWAKDAAGNVSSVPVTSPQNVQVTIQKPAYNTNTAMYNFKLSDAFNAATNGDTIRAMSNTFDTVTESPLNSVTFDRPNVTATLNGGYDALPSGNITGVTIIQVPLSIKNGRLNVSRVAIKQP